MKSVKYEKPIPWKDEKPSLHRMICQIQTYPGMYLGSIALTPLHHFIDGYRAAERDFGICRHGNLFPLDFYYMHDFTKYRLKAECGCLGWCHNILTFCHGDEEKALRLFFDLYQQFRQVELNRYWKAILTKENIAWNDNMEHCYSMRGHGAEPVYKNPIAVYILELTIPIYMLVVETTNEICMPRMSSFFSSVEEAKRKSSIPIGAETYFGKIDTWEEFEANNLYFDKVINTFL